MDEPSADLDPAPASSSSTGLTLVALAVGLLGLVVGGSSIFLAQKAVQENQGIRDQVESEKGMATQSVSDLEKQMESITRQVNAIAENVEALKTRSRMDSNSNRRAFEEMTALISENREQINRNTEEIANIPEQVVVQASPAETTPPRNPVPEQVAPENPVTADPPSAESPETDNSGNRIHVIEAGDTFARLAAIYDVSLTAIQAANPTVNPRRLQIGDRIRIPGN